MTLYPKMVVVGASVFLAVGSCTSRDELGPTIPVRVHVDDRSCVSLLQECFGNDDCPHGSQCQTVLVAQGGSPGDGDAGGTGGDQSELPVLRQEGQCRVPLAQPEPAILVNQLGGDDFSLSRAKDSNVFQWEAPPEARFVTCALFICTPSILGRNVLSSSGCVLASRTYEQQKGSFDLGDPLLKATARRPQAACEEGIRFEPYFSQFSAGCWAYSETDLVGATLLRAAVADDITAARFQMRSSCTAELEETSLGTVEQTWERRNCSLPELSLVGTCRGGQCRQRCLEDLDCQPAKRLGVPVPPCPEATATGDAGAGGAAPDAAAGAPHQGGAGLSAPPTREYVCDRPDGGLGLCMRRCELP